MRKLNLKKPPQFEIKELEDGRFEVRERVQRGRWPFAEYGWISHLITHDKRDALHELSQVISDSSVMNR